MKKLFFLLMIILPVSALGQVKRLPNPPRSPVIKKPQKAPAPKAIDVSINGREITIGETKLTLPFERDVLFKLLGKPDLMSRLANNIYTWHAYGLYGYEKPDETLISSLVLQLNSKDGNTKFTPANNFSGKLLIDGALVTTDSTLKQINELKTGKPFTEDAVVRSTVNIEYENLELGLVRSEKGRGKNPVKLLRFYIEALEKEDSQN